MTNKDDFVKLSPSFIVRRKFAVSTINELQNLDYGVYHLGTEQADLTDKEWGEVTEMTPDDILKG